MNFINLGLPSGTCWGECNILAATPTEFGGFFSYRALMNPSSVESAHFIQLRGFDPRTGYPAIAALPLKDMLRMIGSLAFCVPSQEQMKELISCCDWKLVSPKGVWGFKSTSRYNGKSIFFPMAGRLPDRIVKEMSLVQSSYDLGYLTENERFNHLLDLESYAKKDKKHCCQYLTRSTDPRFLPLGWNGGANALTIKASLSEPLAQIIPVSRDLWLPIRPVLN